jgi:ABC-type molybdate transport system substrate-binding protein
MVALDTLLIFIAASLTKPIQPVPQYASWYADFERNRMVVAYTDPSRHAKEITRDAWTDILQRGDVEVGRTDPNLAPVGYRTLLMFDLVERYYRRAGLAAAIPTNASHHASAARFLAFLESPETLRALHAAHVDMLDRLVAHGTGVPTELSRGRSGF